VPVVRFQLRAREHRREGGGTDCDYEVNAVLGASSRHHSSPITGLGSRASTADRSTTCCGRCRAAAAARAVLADASRRTACPSAPPTMRRAFSTGPKTTCSPCPFGPSLTVARPPATQARRTTRARTRRATAFLARSVTTTTAGASTRRATTTSRISGGHRVVGDDVRPH
jgi:hypothetical protein